MINKALLIGRLGRDPEMRYSQSGLAIVTLSIATNEVWKDKEGKKQERTEWHRVIAYDRQAEVCGQYLSKGSLVFIEGRIQTRDWVDQNNVKRYTTEIIVRNIQFLDSKGSSAPQGLPEDPGPSDDDIAAQPPLGGSEGMEDVPF